MLDKIPTLSYKKVASIPWEDDGQKFDSQICALGGDLEIFKTINPYSEHHDLIHYVKSVPKTIKCIIWSYEGEWVVKLFRKGWKPLFGYMFIELGNPKLTWEVNEYADSLLDFDKSIINSFKITPWQMDYELVWYIDPATHPAGDKVWAFKCKAEGIKTNGTEDMGYVDIATTNLDWQVNEEVENLLDKTIMQTFQVNPWEKKMDYESVWYIDPAVTGSEEKIWAFKCKIKGSTVQGTKDMGYIDLLPLELNWEINKQLEYILDKSTIENFTINPWNRSAEEKYEFVWYVDPLVYQQEDKVWAFRCKIKDATTTGTKDMGDVNLSIPKVLDVIFISYDEPNAESNWLRVLEKAPYAKRVHGIEGIFNAHKAAAELAETDMFYVVDGDAYLTEDWEFDFQPSIFNRDCAFVWSSQNPVNKLIYQNGGVKLFPKSTILQTQEWTSLDMFAGIMPKNKANSSISCIGTFNVSPFLTWRSAFRECVKLYNTNHMLRLKEWTESNKAKPFGEYAILGAQAGHKFAEDNKNNFEELRKINDYKWLNECFQKLEK